MNTPDTVTSAERKLERAMRYEAPRNEVLVRLAEEGVPIAAMARSFALPYEDLVALLQEAVAQSRIVMLPAADWPPGQRRSQRIPTSPHIRGDNPTSLAASLSLAFRLTPAEARLLVKLIKYDHCTKPALHVAMSETSSPATEQKIVDVTICKMRKKLTPAGVKITTVWGMGYRLPAESRVVIMQKLKEQEVTPKVTNQPQDGEGEEHAEAEDTDTATNPATHT